MDHSFLQAIIERQGPLRCYLPSPNGDQVLVKFQRVEDAVQAHRVLSAGNPATGLPPLAIDFISDADIVRVLEQTGGNMPGIVQQQQPPQQRLPDPGALHGMPGGGMDSAGWPTGLGGAFGGAGGMWGASSGSGGMEDHSSFLPSDLFGGQ